MYQDRHREDAEDIVYGLRAVIEAIRSGCPINKIFIQKGMNKELFYELKEELADKKYNLQFVPIHKLNRLTRKNHQGVIAQISPVPYHELSPIIMNLFDEGEVPLVLILDRLTDVRNFGAIARTAECIGVDAIVIPDKDSVSITSDAIKTSAGALNKIPVCKAPELSKVIHEMREFGIQLVAATEKTDNLVFDIDFTLPTAIVLGSEEDGVSMKLLGEVDKKARIPMEGAISSLNVSVSAGIMLYECSRQRLKE